VGFNYKQEYNIIKMQQTCLSRQMIN